MGSIDSNLEVHVSNLFILITVLEGMEGYKSTHFFPRKSRKEVMVFLGFRISKALACEP